MKLFCNSSKPPLGGVLVAEYAKTLHNITIEWGSDSKIEYKNRNYYYETSNDLCRIVAKLTAESQLYGSTPLEKTTVDHWLTFSIGPLSTKAEVNDGIQYLNKILDPITYLVGKRLTIADFAVFAALHVNLTWQTLIAKREAPVNVLRWYNLLNAQASVKNILNSLPNDVKEALRGARIRTSSTENQSMEKTAVRNQEGKFVELPGAEIGKVVVRFPPEASGYLHIGHAKAALLNQYYQQAFQGKLIMRFDDTNPAKENVHFEKVILEDVAMLEIKPDMFTHTSQYFDLMLEYCEKMFKDGTAYVDDTEPELMKQQREQRMESVNRKNSYEKNISLWQEMKNGTELGQKCCVRAMIDMQSHNGCMRDPTIYRCKNEPHPRTGTQYKVYPTYDFACPIVDAIEGVTHTLRTMEYHDRDPQFYWFIDTLKLRKPYIWEYSRLSMTNTVLSKRKLTWFVQEGLVDGWDDPRFPTVRGVLRRGMTVEGLKQFIIAQGSSRSVVFMEWDKIWAFNKKVIDPIAPRFTAIECASVPVLIKGVKEAPLTVPKHPKNTEIGNKIVWVGPKILIDNADAESLKEGENATFINWGNILIKKINRENGKIVSIEAESNFDNKDYKKTLKLTWICDTKEAKFIPTWCVYFDHIINKALLGKDEDFKQYIGHETRTEVEMLGDPELAKLKNGDIIQLQRRGFFKVDVAFEDFNLTTGKQRPVILFAIPDGHTKENPTAGAPKQATATSNKKEKSIDKENVSSGKTRDANVINNDIIKQGDLVRNLKEKKVSKQEIEPAVQTLSALKVEYKSVTNTDWKTGCVAEQPESTCTDLDGQINKQGDKVRQLKSAKGAKSIIEGEVKLLLELKAQYKQKFGKDWQPTSTTALPQTGVCDFSSVNAASCEESVLEKISEQGNKIRDLKSKKVEKSVIEAEVKVLLSLKQDYKRVTGNEWQAGAVATKSAKITESVVQPADFNKLLNKITVQGEKVRQLKADKADKGAVTAEVNILLALKKDFKAATGQEWKPGMQADKEPADLSISATEVIDNMSEASDNAVKDELVAKVNEQGENVRKLKSGGSSKEEIDAAVKKLLELKAEYKTVTGTDFPTGRPSSKSGKPKEAKAKQLPKEKGLAQKQVTKEKNIIATLDDGATKKQTRLGLEAKKEENLSDWYSQVITKGEMIEYYDVSGCYILRPWSYAIWESIKDWFDGEIKKLGVQNCYFPIFVAKSVLEKEKDHIADFAPEVAWVTKSGDSDLAEPIAIRPTSETVMYPAYAKWIQSYRDLPIKLNQWNNVVRWEFKHPQPFLRTREFLWQEGHTAYAVQEEANIEVKTILDLYARIYTDLLAIPVVKGRKTEKEKFAGGDYTFTVEAFVSASGRAIQGATSHHLGQNFSKMFEIVFDDPETQEKKYVYQNSWGITTRTIGVLVMIHADNQGLVLPPRVACVQIVIVPCGLTVGLAETDRLALQKSCDELEEDLKKANIRVKGDYRANYSPGWKFNHWELKGVPIRIELGPKDIKSNQIVAVRRDTGEKITIKQGNAVKDLSILLETIQENLYQKAHTELTTHKILLKDWSQFGSNLDKKNIILSPFCGEMSCEDKIKADSAREDASEPGAPAMGAKSLCIPLEQPEPIIESDRCIHPSCKNKPKYYTLFGRSY